MTLWFSFPTARNARLSWAQQQTIRFMLPPGAEAVVVELCKAAPQQPWEELRAALPLARGGGGAAGGPPDLAELRRALLPAVEGDATLRPAAARLHALQARCQAQLGCLKQAAASYTAAIRLLQQPSAQQGRQAGGQQAEEEAEESQQAQLGQLLVARSAAHEQLEQIESALADAEAAARLRPAPAAALLAVQRLRRACRAKQG
ncbi:ankyrin repeat containing TPR domain-containing [Micractinium conductrix]|uniref:Ankyrin repeat containing TPR domain-containing n=1 Tax=Micractinium conductrix TaxID=554055 RepID=A0A2P6VDC3_9CHLO|nr:ankyrin repeat containing TPR domain-containing [Micractinium conductrix]|eukprot:PSC72077.1 ankyrin repeat containing TPR domain-containing [Micractinium conductrix]